MSFRHEIVMFFLFFSHPDFFSIYANRQIHQICRRQCTFIHGLKHSESHFGPGEQENVFELSDRAIGKAPETDTAQVRAFSGMDVMNA